jgi:ubiquinone/menaquinone biosynthesis C-methylase UbiE
VNCDGIARWYRWIEYAGFGGALQRRRLAFLPLVAEARHILVLGDGDGRFLARLAAQNREAAIDCIDSSSNMLKLARSRAKSGQVRFHHADARTVPFECGSYDLVVTNFFLDCFNQSDAEALVKRIACAARSDARWLVSEFRQGTHGWRAAWAQACLWTLYLFFRIATGLDTNRLVDHHPILERHGFRLAQVESTRFGLLASELWTRIGQ